MTIKKQAPGNLEPLDSEDARILDLENSLIAGHTLKVMVLEDSGDGGLPTLQKVQSRVAERLPQIQIPRLTQRLTTTGQVPGWAPAEDFSLDDHVSLMQPAEGPEAGALESLVARLMRERLDRTRPLWHLHLVTEMAPGRSILVWQVHHCVADGMTATAWATKLLCDLPQSGDHDVLISQHDSGSHSARGDSVARVMHPGGVSEPSHSGNERPNALSTLRHLPGTLWREIRPWKTYSSFSARVGHDREVAFASCGLERMRQVGKSLREDVTINDMVLALVAGAIRYWLHTTGSGMKGMRVEVPVSMHPRSRELDTRGNSDSFFFVDLPLSEPDPVKRLFSISTETKSRKNHHDANTLYAALNYLDRISQPLHRAALRITTSPREYSLNVSNVPGPRNVMHVLGNPVREMYSIAEVAERHALRVAAMSMAGSMFFGLCADPGIVRKLEVLREGINHALAELQDRVGSGGTS